MLALLAGSVYVITKGDRARPRPQGGTELVYQGRRRRRYPRSTPEDIDRAIEIIRQRVDSLGVSEPEISRLGTDQIQVGLPNVSDAERATDQVGDHRAALPLRLRAERRSRRTAEVADPARPSSAATTASSTPSRLAVEAARGSESSAKTDCTTSGPTYYLFDANTLRADRRAVGERRRTCSSTSPTASSRRGHRGDRRSRAAPSCVEDEARRRSRHGHRRVATGSQFFVLHDRPGCRGNDITDPKQDFDQSNQPNVTFDFTDKGREAFQDVTQRHRRARPETASRPRQPARDPVRPTSSRARSRSSSTASSSRGRSSTSSTTRTGSTAAPAPRSPGLDPPGGPGPRRGPADRRAADQAGADQPDRRSRRRSASRRSTRA